MDEKPRDGVDVDRSRPDDEPVTGRITATLSWDTAVALLAGMRPRYPYDLPRKRAWIVLAIFFLALSAYAVASEPRRGQLAITSVPAAGCSAEDSAYCASNPIPRATVLIDGDRTSVTVTTGPDGRVVVGLVPGEYRVLGTEVGDLDGIGDAVAVIRAGQTTEVRVSFARRLY